MQASRYADPVPAVRPDSSRQDWSPATTPQKEPRKAILEPKIPEPPAAPAETKAEPPPVSTELPAKKEPTEPIGDNKERTPALATETAAVPAPASDVAPAPAAAPVPESPLPSSPAAPRTGGLMASRYAQGNLIDLSEPAKPDDTPSTDIKNADATNVDTELDTNQESVDIPNANGSAIKPIANSTQSILDADQVSVQPTTTAAPVTGKPDLESATEASDQAPVDKSDLVSNSMVKQQTDAPDTLNKLAAAPEPVTTTVQPTDPAVQKPTTPLKPAKAPETLAKSPPPLEVPSIPLSAVPERIATPSGIQRTDSRASNSSTGKIRKTSKKGKPCIIRLPKDGAKTYSGFTVPMSAKDFLKRLETFQHQGYDTRGYAHWNVLESADREDIGAQNCLDFPTHEDQKEEITLQDNRPAIAIPDMRKWDDYVNYLMEEKLKALGVDVPPEPIDEQELDALQQGTSPFPTNAFSPPLPTSSAASQKVFQNILPFSAPFSPVSTNNTSIGAIGTPTGNQSLGETLSRQQSGYGFNFPTLSQQNQPSWSPQGMFNNPAALSRGGTPAAASLLPQRQPSVLSQAHEPVTENQSTPKGRFAELTSPAHNASQQQIFQFGDPMQQGQSQFADNDYTNENSLIDQTPTTPDNKAIGQDNSENYGDLAYPTPRGHRHNISANLEREAEAAQYYPGEYVNENAPQHQQVSNEPSSAEDGWQQSQQPQNSFDRLPGLNSWKPGHSTRPSMASNASSSKLNVEAKEFKFDPTKAHSKKYSVSKTAFMPDTSQPARIDPLHPFLSLTNVTAHKGLKTSSLNVDAPSFEPPMAQAVFSLPKSSFNFSAAMPKDHSSRASSVQPDDSLIEAEKANDAPKIFSQINLADIVKPPKQSKAVAIVNPNDIPAKDDDNDEEELEGDDGRAIQSDARRKRGRRTADDGDAVPLFATPTPEPSQRAQGSPASVRGITFASPAAPPTPVEPTKILSSNVPNEVQKNSAPEEEPKVEEKANGKELPWHGIEDETKAVRPVSRSPPTARDRPSHLGGFREEDDGNNFLSFQEIDAVMEHLNNDNSDFGVEHSPVKEGTTPAKSIEVTTIAPKQPPTTEKNKEESGKLLKTPAADRLDAKSDRSIRSERVSELSAREGSRARPEHSPVRKLNKFGDAPISDWDDMLASGEELIIPAQHASQYADPNVATLVEGLLRRHLEPFEKSLHDMGALVKNLSARNASRGPRPASAFDKSDSDADDEDEEDTSSQRHPRAIKSDRNIEKIKAAVLEAVTSSQSGGLGQVEQEAKFRKAAESRAEDMQRLLGLAEKEIALFKEQSDQYEDKIKALDDERKEAMRRNTSVEEELRSKTLSFTAEIASLENTLDEYRSSSSSWKDELESVKKSRETLSATIEKLRKEAADNGRTRDTMDEKIRKMEDDITATSRHLASERAIWQRKDEDLAKRYEILQVRYQEDARIRNKLEIDLGDLREREKENVKTAVMLEETQNAKARLEESVTKLNEEILREQRNASQYERVMIEAKEKTTTQVSRIRKLLEADIDVANTKTESVRAEFESRLGIAKAELENARSELEALKKRHETLHEENTRYHKKALRDTNERHRSQLEEERSRFENSLKELSERHDRAFREHGESSIKTLEEERVKSRQTIDDLATQHERVLNETTQSHTTRLEEERTRANKTVEDLVVQHERALNNALEDNQRSLDDLAVQHERVLTNALEDKQRSDTHHQESLLLANQKAAHLNESLALSQSKIEHLTDKVSHLEDKVNVAQSAAQAAVQSAKLAKSSPTATVEVLPGVPAPVTAAVPVSKTAQFEKVSPQALRESIVVLQEQLQEREGRIESLELELSEVDKEAPSKLIERDQEVTWLRELLGVRIDDLSDLVNSLSQRDFDRHAARDAAIRIRANLQMEQQERERYLASGKTGGFDSNSLRRGSGAATALPSLTDIQNFASPKAAQLAAAWGNWRKGRENGSPSLQSLREAVNAGTPSSSSRRAGQAGMASSTSARRESSGKGESSNAASGFLSGLMTPPASNLRRATPTPSSVSSTTVIPPMSNRPVTPRRSSSSSSRPGTQSSPTSARSINNRSPTSTRATSLQLQRQQSWEQGTGKPRRRSSAGKARAPASRLQDYGPASPPLLSSGSYDMDAEDHSGIYEEDEATGGERDPEKVMEETRLMPLGEQLASAFPLSNEQVIEEEDEEDDIDKAAAVQHRKQDSAEHEREREREREHEHEEEEAGSARGEEEDDEEDSGLDESAIEGMRA